MENYLSSRELLSRGSNDKNSSLGQPIFWQFLFVAEKVMHLLMKNV